MPGRFKTVDQLGRFLREDMTMKKILFRIILGFVLVMILGVVIGVLLIDQIA